VTHNDAEMMKADRKNGRSLNGTRPKKYGRTILSKSGTRPNSFKEQSLKGCSLKKPIK